MSPASGALNHVLTSQDCQNHVLLCWTWMNLSFYSQKSKIMALPKNNAIDTRR